MGVSVAPQAQETLGSGDLRLSTYSVVAEYLGRLSKTEIRRLVEPNSHMLAP